MSTFMLRDVPQPLWDRFKARAAAEQWAMRPLVLQLMQDYVDGRITPSRGPDPSPSRGNLFAICASGHTVPMVLSKGDVLARGVPTHAFCPICHEAVTLNETERAAIETWSRTATTPAG